MLFHRELLAAFVYLSVVPRIRNGGGNDRVTGEESRFRLTLPEKLFAILTLRLLCRL